MRKEVWEQKFLTIYGVGVTAIVYINWYD